MTDKGQEQRQTSLQEIRLGLCTEDSRVAADAMLCALNDHQLTIGRCIDAALMVLTSILCQASNSPKAITILADNTSSLVVPMTAKTFSDIENRRAMGMDEDTYQLELAEIQLEVMQQRGEKAS